MDIPRALIYKDRQQIEEFGISDDSFLNKRLYEDWIFNVPDLRPGDIGFSSRILQVFNDAYYICTVVLMKPLKCHYCLPYYLSKTKLPSVVIHLVYYYLKRVDFEHPSISLLLKAIKTEIKREGWDELLKNIEAIGKNKVMPRTLFSRRELNSEFLSTIDWNTITNHYSSEGIMFIERNIAKNDEEIKEIAQAIKESAKKLEDEFYEYQQEPYIEEETLDYDNEPDENDYLPDYTETYQLCDSIINSDNPSSLFHSQQIVQRDISLPQFQLQRFLRGDWFSNYSADTQTYTEQWRNNMVDALLSSQWGNFFANEWSKRDNMIKCALVGALKDVGVLKPETYTRYGESLTTIIGLKVETITKYMSDANMKPYSLWLKDYIEDSPEE